MLSVHHGVMMVTLPQLVNQCEIGNDLFGEEHMVL